MNVVISKILICLIAGALAGCASSLVDPAVDLAQLEVQKACYESQPKPETDVQFMAQALKQAVGISPCPSGTLASDVAIASAKEKTKRWLGIGGSLTNFLTFGAGAWAVSEISDDLASKADNVTVKETSSTTSTTSTDTINNNIPAPVPELRLCSEEIVIKTSIGGGTEVSETIPAVTTNCRQP